MKIIALVLILFLTGCTSLTRTNQSDELHLVEAALKYGINETKKCSDCEIKNAFISAENTALSADFIRRFQYDNIDVYAISKSSTRCETGAVIKNTQSRGYAFTIFNVDYKRDDHAIVKWGYWYSCQSYLYQYVHFIKTDNQWRFSKVCK